MEITQYYCDRCGKEVEFAYQLCGMFYKTEYFPENDLERAKEIRQIEKELCTECANELKDRTEKWLESYGKLIVETEWFYTKDKLPEKESTEEEPVEERSLLAAKKGGTVVVTDVNGVLEDAEAEEPLLYAWAEMVDIPEELEEIEPPEEPTDPTDPTDPDDNTDPEGPDQNP